MKAHLGKLERFVRRLSKQLEEVIKKKLPNAYVEADLAMKVSQTHCRDSLGYFKIGMLSTVGGFGSDCRKAKISAACWSLTTLAVYGGISPVGLRI